MDPNPLFSRFVKTLFVVLACCLWVNPYFSTRDLLVLVPLLALLTGHHYALLVRRHGDDLHRLVRHLAMAGVAMAGGILLFYVVPPELWEDLPFRLDLGFRESFRWQGLGLAAAALGASAYLVLRPGRHPVWCHLLAVCAAGMLCYWALFDPYRAQDCAKAELGLAIRRHMLRDLGLPPEGELPPDLVVYKGPRTQGLYNEGGYLGCPIQRLKRYQDLPPEAEAVYVLCVVVPVHPSRQWGVPLMRTDYAGRRLYLYKGMRAKTGEEGKP